MTSIKWQYCSSLSFTFTVINNLQLNHYLIILLDWSLEDELWQFILTLLLLRVLLNIIRPVHHLALSAMLMIILDGKVWMEDCVLSHGPEQTVTRAVDENDIRDSRWAHTLSQCLMQCWATANETSAQAWCPLKSQITKSHMPGARLTKWKQHKLHHTSKLTDRDKIFTFTEEKKPVNLAGA